MLGVPKIRGTFLGVPFIDSIFEFTLGSPYLGKRPKRGLFRDYLGKYLCIGGHGV